MRLSTLLGRTLRDAPNEADQIGYQLILRAGLARAVAPGSFALLPLGMAVLRRIEAIMHAEMAAIGGQEFRTPVVQTAALWQASGRYEAYGPQMLRMADRNERALVLAPTHEEAVADLARREIDSYRRLPALIYQIHTKYRDEIRTKGGLMRMREFTMLDAYSLDADFAGLATIYAQVGAAFERIFARCGVAFVAVEASAGEMGGREPLEYMARSAAGEDTLVICEACGYAANAEVAQAAYGSETFAAEAGPIAEIATPATATIADLARLLAIPTAATAKAVFFDTPERGLIFAVIRGDLEVSEAKLQQAAGVSELRPADAAQILAAGAVPGYASPVGLALQSATQAGVFVIADRSLLSAGPLVAGANRAGYHLRNVLYGRDWQASLEADIAEVRAGDACVRCAAPLVLQKGVEIGHIFQLGTRFAEALGAHLLNEQGAQMPLVMGSYGIGLERLIQIIVEQHHDERGIVWPVSVAPADVHIVPLGKGTAAREEAARIYAELQAAGLRPLLDDRDETAGIKFNDADLIGLPLRLVVSDRLLAAAELELKPRSGEALKIPRNEMIAQIRTLLASPSQG